MELIELKCKNCGAKLKVNPETEEVTCQYCKTVFRIDDEANHVKIDNMEQSGYEFEKGRIRAQQENIEQGNQNNKSNNAKNSNNRILWLVLAWIFLFPFTATYFIVKSNKIEKNKKIIIIIAMWIVFLIIGWSSNEQEKAGLKVDNNHEETNLNKNTTTNIVENNQKEDYEFETIEGYTTLQSLILNINDLDNYKKIKNMADYCGFYIKDSTGFEADGIVKIIYNTGEIEYYNKATEHVTLYFDDFKGNKLDKIEYKISNSSLEYDYYISEHSKSNVYEYNKERQYFETKEDAFKYINNKIGYTK